MAIAIIIGLAVIGVGLAFGYSGGKNEASADSGTSPRISLEQSTLDWGTVSAAAGPVSREVKITNNGTRDLIIKKISTSCGCTSARLTTAQRTTPVLAMDHGGNLPPIRETIKPGEEAKLAITYDPNTHYVRGPITRVVYIVSDDPDLPEAEINNNITVTD